jgi:TATA-box binding protein (TBP) (component of TFIID and TFIIIB)
MKTQSNNIDDEWSKFLLHDSDESDDNCETLDEVTNYIPPKCNAQQQIPVASDIYISTKTKISYLNTAIDLANVFWKIPVISYASPQDGVVKKQMKFNSFLEEELASIQNKLVNEHCYEEHVITSINNPTGRIKFKDIRKISIGISKKDIMNCRSKQKSAFYNCIVIILRMKHDNSFKEYHVKIFNTGKLEIPGVQNDESFIMILKLVVQIIQPHVETHIFCDNTLCDTVLINSNFNCGFYINREVLYDLLKMKYNIQSIYDPCSYPGIQCKFYYNPDIGIQNGSQISDSQKQLYKDIKKVSFMVFRTGSVLIVGRCDDNVIIIIYNFIKELLMNEYEHIHQRNTSVDNINNTHVVDKKKKTRKKQIILT